MVNICFDWPCRQLHPYAHELPGSWLTWCDARRLSLQVMPRPTALEPVTVSEVSDRVPARGCAALFRGAAVRA
jgi:hypothetical protein